jgi:hypothetical protein
MNINYEETLLEDNDEVEDCIDSREEYCSPTKIDARRLIERRQELARLRELLDDPSLDLEYT